jgi:MarR family transcriptional regulator, 2-MHQ and catechol-resistance regulon repressor
MPKNSSNDEAVQAYIKLIRAATSVSQRAGRTLSDSGLTMAQFGVLDALVNLGPMKLGQLAAKHLKSPNNLTAVVDGMERAGWVARRKSKEDRREIFVELLPAGQLMYEKAWPCHREAIQEEMAVLSPQELDLFSGLLRRVGLGLDK